MTLPELVEHVAVGFSWGPPGLASSRPILFVFVLGGSVEAALRPLTTRDSTSLSLFLLCWILPELSHLHLIDRLDCRSHNITARAVMFETTWIRRSLNSEGVRTLRYAVARRGAPMVLSE